MYSISHYRERAACSSFFSNYSAVCHSLQELVCLCMAPESRRVPKVVALKYTKKRPELIQVLHLLLLRHKHRTILCARWKIHPTPLSAFPHTPL
jgi:hypothetical protein